VGIFEGGGAEPKAEPAPEPEPQPGRRPEPGPQPGRRREPEPQPGRRREPEPQPGQGQSTGPKNAENPDGDRETKDDREEEDQDARDSRDSEDWADVRRVYHNRVDFHFHGEVDASEAVFGAVKGGSERISTRRATGVLNRRDVDAALRAFVPPQPFERAGQVLREQHLVVLVADEGCGRRTGALALLRHAAGEDARLTSLSPALSFGQLAAKVRFESGVGYLVADYLGEGEAAAVREFEAAGLADKLRQAGAYLALTATPVAVSSRALPRYCVRWTQPDLGRLFDKGVRGAAIAPEHLESARLRAARLRTPQEVANLVRRLVNDPQGAASVLHDAASNQVTSWFEGKPVKREVLAVAALTFLHGLPERVFEGHLARLLELAEEAGTPEPAAVPDLDRELVQRRIGFTRKHELVTVQRATVVGCVGPVNERVVVFRSPQHRGHVIVELYDKYGYELWEPLRRWLYEIAVSASPEVRVELAFGLALLARTAFGEVADVIDQWAGSEMAAARLTAASTLWWMCVEDPLLPAALQTAMRWVHNRGQLRAITAAIAFGGDLGLRYQSDALRWLWFLARRAERIGAVARQSIAYLFSSAVADSGSCRAVLTVAGRELRQAVASETDERTMRAVRQAVVAMLGASDGQTDEPVVVSLVREQPDNLPALGALWADVLGSAPHRREAFEILVRCLSALGPEHREHVRLLGDAVLSGLPELHQQILRRDLTHAASQAARAGRPSHDLVSALLGLQIRSTEPNPVKIFRGDPRP
jgi:hypothetical protein